MDQQRILHLLLSRAINIITRLALRTQAAFAFGQPSPPRKRLLFISSFSLFLALALVWMGAGLPRLDGSRVVVAAGTTRFVATTGVDTLNNCSVAVLPCLTVQHAADQSASGDEIRIAGGTYTGVAVRDTVTQVVFISQSLTLRGGYTTTDSFAASDPIANPTILDAGGLGRVLYISGVDASISDLTIQNGNSMNVGANGGGINASSALTLTHVTFISNTVNFEGGGVYVGGPATLIGGLFQHNTASGGAGGGLHAGGTLSLTGTQFISNTAGGYGGGGVWTGGAATISDALFRYNSSFGNGGGLEVQGMLSMSDTQFLSNTTNLFGGGVHVLFGATLNGGLFQNNSSTGQYGAGGGLMAENTLSLTGTQFISNSAPGGGGGVYASALAMMTDAIFQNNASPGFAGGGVYAFGPLELTAVHFMSNTAGGGAGVYAVGPATVTGGVFQNNSAYGLGGGLLGSSSLSITGTSFLSNTVNRGGAGVLAAGRTTLYGGLFQSNNVIDIDGTSIGGAGILVDGSLALTDTKFLNNRVTTSGGGGGALYDNSGTARLVNSLFAANSTTNGTGGAIYLKSPGSVQILHTTIASPTVGSGSAIYIANGTVGITDTIVASFTTGITVAGGTVYENYNLFFGNGMNHVGTTGGTNDVLSGDLRFIDPLSDNYHLNAGSAAIDVGVNVGITTDIDGDMRPFGTGYDIGYDEWIGKLLYLPLVRR